jgi:MinD-like ATPase involved in chromosome partitioning or flagellar assembly
MRVISIISPKGSVGKTMIAANLGSFLADAELRVLLDLPPIFTRAMALLRGTSDDWRERHE